MTGGPEERYFRPRAPAGQHGTRPAEPASAHRPGQGLRLPSRRVRRRRLALVVTGTLSSLVLLVAGVMYVFTGYIAAHIPKIDAGLGGHSGPRGAMNILLVGVDRRQGIPRTVLDRLHLGTEPGERSDTMLLVHLNDAHDHVTVVSLQRDAYVGIPGHGMNKLNAAFSLGGPKLAVQTVEQNTGVRIDHFVEVNFLGFIKVVDALGGVEVCTPRPVHDAPSGLSLSAGRHQLDGVQALAYVRARHAFVDGSDDLARIPNQQRFMAAMVAKSVGAGTLADPVRFSRFVNSVIGALSTDEGLTAGTMRTLAGQLRDVSADNVTFTTVPEAQRDLPTPAGTAVRWDPQAAWTLFNKIRKDEPIGPTPDATPRASSSAVPSSPPPAPGQITLAVFNGTGRSGLGAQARADLIRVGFGVPAPARNWTATDVLRTVVEYNPSDAAAAQVVADAIPGAVLRQATAPRATIRVIVGASYSGASPPRTAIDPPPGVSARTATQSVATCS